MGFSELRDKRIPDSERQSCAEVLAAMDCLMHHMNDEDEIAYWLQDGVPDNNYWNLLHTVAPGPAYAVMADRTRFYRDIVEGMTYDEFESCVKIFANAVKRQCFSTKYQPRSFT